MTDNSRTFECTRCRDLGYTTLAGVRWADARACECQMPCVRCDGEGRMIRRDDSGRTYVARCACQGLERRVHLFREARLPAAYHQKTIEGYECESPEQRRVVRWLQEFGRGGAAGARGILMMGNPGIGKTHLLCGTLRFLTLERSIRCRYIDSFQLLEQLRATFGQGGGSSAIMEQLSNVPILALDELGKTRTSGWQREVLDQIVSRRYDQGLTTFLTANYGPARNPADAPPTGDSERLAELVKKDTLQDRVGVRIYSRLMEMCKPFVMAGPDRRLRSTGVRF